jgi:hypothetical protein
LAEFAAKELAPFGFSVVQIDDKWQSGVSTNGPRRNFTTHNPEGSYPTGMKAAADHVSSLGPRADHPQLLSTSRHVTQGIIDVTAETWDAESQTLSGESHVVGGDPYELRIALPTEQVAEVNASSGGEEIESELATTTGLVRVSIKSAKSQSVRWSVRFK